MTAENIVSAAAGLLALGALIWFFGGPWQELWTAFTRQRLFELRNQLFNLAADGKIAFVDPAYRELRDHLNVSIRFAHALTFGALVAFLVARDGQTDPAPALPGAIERVGDPDVRQSLRDIMQEAALAVAVHMVIRSPALWVMLPMVMAGVALSSKGTTLISKALERLMPALEARDRVEAHAR